MERLDIYILTFNCARNLIDIDRFASGLFNPLPAPVGESEGRSFGPPDLLVLSLQEIAPIAYAFLGGSYLAPYFDAFNQAVKKAVAKQWDEHYVNLVQEHTGMTGLMIFARAEITDRMSWIDTAHVGFGVQEMGNKGAVGARLGYAVDGLAPTVDLTFVAAHLAPMEDGYEQRNLDWQSLVERLVFAPDEDTAQRTSNEARRTSDVDETTALLHSPAATHSRRDLFAPNTYLFVAGDLNYRTSNVGPAKGDVLLFPRRDADPSSPAHYSHLLKEDQLRREMHQGRSFHGLVEAPIEFPPTYKYSDAAREAARLDQDDKFVEWKWSSHRWPSWCDRILYRDEPSWAGGGSAERVKPLIYNALPLLPQSDHRPVALAASVPLQTAEGSPGASHRGSETRSVAPFSIDPNWRQRRDAARRKEIAVGWAAYLGLTWEGNGMLLAFGAGLFGAWFVLRSLLDA